MEKKAPPLASFHRREDSRQETHRDSNQVPTYINKHYVNLIHSMLVSSPVDSLAVPLSEEELRREIVRSSQQSALLLPALTNCYRCWSPERKFDIRPTVETTGREFDAT